MGISFEDKLTMMLEIVRGASTRIDQWINQWDSPIPRRERKNISKYEIHLTIVDVAQNMRRRVGKAYWEIERALLEFRIAEGAFEVIEGQHGFLRCYMEE